VRIVFRARLSPRPPLRPLHPRPHLGPGRPLRWPRPTAPPDAATATPPWRPVTPDSARGERREARGERREARGERREVSLLMAQSASPSFLLIFLLNSSFFPPFPPVRKRKGHDATEQQPNVSGDATAIGQTVRSATHPSNTHPWEGRSGGGTTTVSVRSKGNGFSKGGHQGGWCSEGLRRLRSSFGEIWKGKATTRAGAPFAPWRFARARG